MVKVRIRSEFGALRAVSRLDLLGGLVFCALVAAILSIGPAAARADGDPASLLNTSALVDPTPFDPSFDYPAGLFAATAAERQSLQDLEDEAVADTLADHGLPASDATAAQTWGRDTAIGELWGLVVQAINASPRTTDQANVVDWLAQVVERENIAADEDAGIEYAKWAGLGASGFRQLLVPNVSESQLESFLSQPPVTYTFPGCLASCPESTSNEGYCIYESPANMPSDDTYTANIYGNSAPQQCFTACTNLLGCTPPTPSEDQFFAWGEADATNGAFDSTTWATVADDVGKTFGYGAATASIGLLLGGGLTTLVASTASATGGLVAALTPFSGVAGAALGVGGAVGIVAALAAIGVVESINLGNAAALPGELASTISGDLSTDSPPAEPDLVSLLQGDGSSEAYALFIGATLPAPSTSPGCTICLNAPAVPTESDATFTVAQRYFASTATSSSTIEWKDSADSSTHSAYVSGRWFVDTKTASGDTDTTQTLDIQYTDWSGNEEDAWITGDDQFVIAQPNGDQPIDPTTCLADGTCQTTAALEYVGTDGSDLTATLAPGGGMQQGGGQTKTGPPAVPGCEYRGGNCITGSETSISASSPIAEVGRPVTLTITTTSSDCSSNPILGEVCSAVGDGTVDVYDVFDNVRTTVCSSLAESSGTATCTWTPDAQSGGSHDLYATFTPVDTSGTYGSLGELTITAGTRFVTTTRLAASSSTPTRGEDVTYTATIADLYPVDAGNDELPPGSVWFTNGSTVLCGAVPLTYQTSDDTYVATCTTSYDQAGPETVTATYGGHDPSSDDPPGHLPSSGSVEVSVPPGPTTIDIAVLPLVVAGASFPVVVDITAPGVASELVSGSATISDPASSSQCTATLNYGIGYCDLTAAQQGQLTLEVSYTKPYDNDDEAIASQTVTVDSPIVDVTVSGSRVYGSTGASLTATNDAPSGIGTAGTVTCTGVSGGRSLGSLRAGSYNLDGSTCSGLSLTGSEASLFSIAYAGAAGGFTVTPARLTITASSGSMTSGGEVPTVTPQYSGFVNGDKPSSLTTAPTCSTMATSSSSPGSYRTSCSGAVDGDYDIGYADGVLTVTPKPSPGGADQESSPGGGQGSPPTGNQGSSSGGGSAQPAGSAQAGANGSSVSVAKLTGLSPASGPVAGGTEVVITGTSFVLVKKVRFGSRSARFTVVSPQKIRAVAPPGAGTVAVTVTTRAGTSTGTRVDRFSYLLRSRVLRVTPASGPVAGGTEVVITGTSFVLVKKVRFGSRSARFTVVSPQKIRAVAPPGAGTVAVTVTTRAGTSAATHSSRFAYSTR